MALAHTKHIDWKMQDKLLKGAKSYLLEVDRELAEGLSASDKQLWESAIDAYQNQKEKSALKFLYQIHQKTDLIYGAIGQLYHEKQDYSKAVENYDQAFNLGFGYDLENLEEYPHLIRNALTFFLSQKKYPFLLQYFQSEEGKKLNVKDRFKPIYYALMYFLQDQYPTEYLRMPPEMKETVEEIIAKVEQMRVDDV